MVKKKLILLIDDEKFLLEMVQYQLQAKGYEVVTAGNGLEGMEKLQIIHPDLIILDMNMPVMGGIDFYKHILQNSGRTLYPVLALTARANLQEFFKDMNIDGFMSKPFEIPALLAEVERIIQKQAGDSADAPSREGAPQKVFVVEHDEDFFGRLGSALLVKGASVKLFKSGADAMRTIPQDFPDVVCVQANLIDMPGDAVIRKLKSFPEASKVRFILYASPIAGAAPAAVQSRPGIDKIVSVNTVSDLVGAIMSA